MDKLEYVMACAHRANQIFSRAGRATDERVIVARLLDYDKDVHKVDFKRMYEGRDVDLIHDVAGILKHDHLFLPRYAILDESA